MKKIFKLFILFFLFSNIAFAFEYSENDKEIFYDSFIDGYIEQMTIAVNSLDIEQAKKEKFLKEFIKNINKQNLINSSWGCITKYPIKDIVTASVVCTQEWTENQTVQNKKIFEAIK